MWWPVSVALGNCVYEVSRLPLRNLWSRGNIEIAEYTQAFMNARETAMQKHVRDELPDPAMQYVARPQPQEIDDDGGQLRRQEVRLIAPLNRRLLPDLALHAVADLGLRQRRVLAEHRLGDEAQAVLVLKEPPLIRPQIGAVRAAEHFKRRELDDRGLEPRLIDDDGGGVGFEDGAGEDHREWLADTDRPGGRAPPALQRIGRHVLRRCACGCRGEE